MRLRTMTYRYCHCWRTLAFVALTITLNTCYGIPVLQDEQTENNNSGGELDFVLTPQHTEAELGTSITLGCKTSEPVEDCQWFWQPLPPKHLPSPNTENHQETKQISANDIVANNSSAQLSVLIRHFSAFGNQSNDCSIRFDGTKHEQAGYWTCAVKRKTDEQFKNAPPAKLEIIHLDRIKFEETPERVIEVPIGYQARLGCSLSRGVRECQWFFRFLNQSQPWDTALHKFPGAGDSGRECGLTISQMTAEQEGIWTCGAKVGLDDNIMMSGSPIKLLASQVEFVQLSSGVQKTVGETVVLKCLANKPASKCEWSWRSSDSSGNSSLARAFAPAGDADNDCSLRIKSVTYEEEGLWTCGVRLSPRGALHEAPGTTLSLLPSGRVNFTESPESTSTARGTDVKLRCVTNGRVERCAWSWRPINGAGDESSVREFSSSGDLGRDCSLSLVGVTRQDEGYWTCRAYLASQNFAITSPPAKLTVYEPEDVRFSELSKDIQLSIGGTVNLRCVTTGPVEQCRWSLTPDASGGNTTVVVMQFSPAGQESRDCSVKLSHALTEQEGLWRCGARPKGRLEYKEAPPARLSLIEQEPIAMTIWNVPHQLVTLACKYGPTSLEALCYWRHGTKLITQERRSRKKSKYIFSMNYTSGICSLQFTPDKTDAGLWSCQFKIDKENVYADLGTATILLLSTNPDQQIGWLVGAITSVVLFLLILIVVIIVYKTQMHERRTPSVLETLSSKEKSRQSQT